MKPLGTPQSKQPADPPALIALRRAAKIALELAVATGTPCYVWQDGKVVDIAAQHRQESPKSKKKNRDQL